MNLRRLWIVNELGFVDLVTWQRDYKDCPYAIATSGFGLNKLDNFHYVSPKDFPQVEQINGFHEVVLYKPTKKNHGK
jgi:hypothetical protein